MGAKKTNLINRNVLCVGVNPAYDVTVEVDGLEEDRVNRALSEHCQAAGKAANVACGLAAEGFGVGLAGLFGIENFPEWKSLFIEQSEYGVMLAPVFCSGRIRKNFTLLVGGRTVKINYPGCKADDAAMDRLTDLVSEASGEGHIAVFTGSLPPGMSCGRYLELIRAASDAGSRVVIDTDRLSLQEILSVRPWIYKPNAHELAAISGVDAEDDDGLISCAQQMAAKGVDIVLLTLGSRGLAAVTAKQTVKVAARKVRAINTVGAGDAALAAFIAAQLRDESLEECARKAADAGARTVAEVH